jgi:hypothetical protein
LGLVSLVRKVSDFGVFGEAANNGRKSFPSEKARQFLLWLSFFPFNALFLNN